MANIVPDETATNVETVGVSPKAWASGAAGAGLGAVAAVLQLAQGSPNVFGLPPVWGIVLSVGLPPIVTFLSAAAASLGSVRQINRSRGF